jgi:hypothetical protein
VFFYCQLFKEVYLIYFLIFKNFYQIVLKITSGIAYLTFQRFYAPFMGKVCGGDYDESRHYTFEHKTDKRGNFVGEGVSPPAKYAPLLLLTPVLKIKWIGSQDRVTSSNVKPTFFKDRLLSFSH